MRHAWLGLLTTLFLAGLAGCRSLPDAAPASAPEAAVAPTPATAKPPSRELPITEVAADSATPEFPASYAGSLPCADCAGLDYRLNLFGDGVYYLRETYRGRPEGDQAFDDVGRWRRSADGATLELHGGRERPLQFARQSDGSLELLDQDGHAMASALNYRLVRDGAFQPLEPSVPMRGMLTVDGDAARFQDCLSGRDLPVLTEGDAAAMRAAFAAGAFKPGQRVLATTQGRFVRRLLVAGDVKQEALVVERFRKLWPGETCGPRYADANLEGTRWRLLELNGQRVAPQDSPQVAAIGFDPATGRVSGSTGCNRLTAGYTRQGEALNVAAGATTRMACPGAAMSQESEFLKMLARVARATVVGQTLELRDGDGTVMARFDAVPAE